MTEQCLKVEFDKEKSLYRIYDESKKEQTIAYANTLSEAQTQMIAHSVAVLTAKS